jgi:BlaI family transcriptional regulator, penicillinase repressor
MSAAPLSRREREIMDILHRDGELSVSAIQKAMPDPPGYSAVRAMLRTLEEKGHVKHREDSLRYVYSPVVSAAKARQSAVKHLLDTFFQGSVEQAVSALLDVRDGKLEKPELDRIARIIAQARKEGR